MIAKQDLTIGMECEIEATPAKWRPAVVTRITEEHRDNPVVYLEDVEGGKVRVKLFSELRTRKGTP